MEYTNNELLLWGVVAGIFFYVLYKAYTYREQKKKVLEYLSKTSLEKLSIHKVLDFKISTLLLSEKEIGQIIAERITAELFEKKVHVETVHLIFHNLTLINYSVRGNRLIQENIIKYLKDTGALERYLQNLPQQQQTFASVHLEDLL